MSAPAARAEAARLRAELDRPDLIPDADLEAVAKAETPVVIGWEYLPPLEGKPRRRAGCWRIVGGRQRNRRLRRPAWIGKRG